jgi:hypothetical protein
VAEISGDDRESARVRLRATIARREFWLKQYEMAELPRPRQFAAQIIAMYDADIAYLSLLVPSRDTQIARIDESGYVLGEPLEESVPKLPDAKPPA